MQALSKMQLDMYRAPMHAATVPSQCVCAAGFKSRALRVGGAVQAPAETQAADAHADAAPAAQQPSTAAADAGVEAVADAGDGHDAAAGRKRRAAAESVPSPSVSPKLAAAIRHGQQCRVQPGEVARHSREGATSCVQGLQEQSLSGAHQAAVGSGPGAGDKAPGVSPHAAEAVTSTDDDSVPLVGSKLAARSQDRGTPLAAGRGRDAGRCWHVLLCHQHCCVVACTVWLKCH